MNRAKLTANVCWNISQNVDNPFISRTSFSVSRKVERETASENLCTGRWVDVRWLSFLWLVSFSKYVDLFTVAIYFWRTIPLDVLKIISGCGAYIHTFIHPANRHKSLCEFIRFSFACDMLPHGKNYGNSSVWFFSRNFGCLNYITTAMNENIYGELMEVLPNLDSLDIDFVHKITIFTSFNHNESQSFSSVMKKPEFNWRKIKMQFFKRDIFRTTLPFFVCDNLIIPVRKSVKETK